MFRNGEPYFINGAPGWGFLDELKAAGLSVYKLMGGKNDDKVRCYKGGVRVQRGRSEPEHLKTELFVSLHGKVDWFEPSFLKGFYSPAISPCRHF